MALPFKPSDLRLIRYVACHQRPGQYRLACPYCARRKHRQRDQALSLLIEPNGSFVAFCHRCDQSGAGADLDCSRHARRTQRRRRRHDGRFQDAEHASARAHLSDWAIALWRQCRPIQPGDPAWVYLTERGCRVPPEEGDLRWHPALKHPCGYCGPALIGLVTNIYTSEPSTLHRTWLAPDGSDKAPIKPARMLLAGHTKRDGVIRLYSDEGVTTGLCLAEGIETALTAAHGFSPVWSVIDAGNMQRFPVLPGIECLTVCVDHDEAGQRAWEAVKTRWLDAGRQVRMWISETVGQDLNDLYGRGKDDKV